MNSFVRWCNDFHIAFYNIIYYSKVYYSTIPKCPQVYKLHNAAIHQQGRNAL